MAVGKKYVYIDGQTREHKDIDDEPSYDFEDTNDTHRWTEMSYYSIPLKTDFSAYFEKTDVTDEIEESDDGWVYY